MGIIHSNSSSRISINKHIRCDFSFPFFLFCFLCGCCLDLDSFFFLFFSFFSSFFFFFYLCIYLYNLLFRDNAFFFTLRSHRRPLPQVGWLAGFFFCFSKTQTYVSPPSPFPPFVFFFSNNIGNDSEFIPISFIYLYIKEKNFFFNNNKE